MKKTAPTKRILYFQNPGPSEALSEALLYLTPKVSLVKNGIYADLAPTAHLFGGEEALLQKALALLTTFEVDCPWVLTERIEWAQALLDHPQNVFKPGESWAALNFLPIESLMQVGNPVTLEDTKTERKNLAQLMRRVGMPFISDFLKLNPTAINRRFGKLGMDLFHWVQGNSEICLPIFSTDEPIEETIDAESLGSLENLLFILKQVLGRFESRLRGRGILIKALTLECSLDSRKKLSHTIPFAVPTLESEPVLRVVREVLTTPEWDSPLRSLKITVSDSVPLQPAQLALWDTSEQRFSQLAEYIQRLRTRLGETSVGFIRFKSSFLPENSWEVAFPPESKPQEYPLLQRPLFLFNTPKPFEISLATKLLPTENLHTHWWERFHARHYFMAEDKTGDRWWVYWDLKEKNWFAHGSFD